MNNHRVMAHTRMIMDCGKTINRAGPRGVVYGGGGGGGALQAEDLNRAAQAMSGGRKPFLSFFIYCNTPSRGLRAGGLRLKATVQKVFRKRTE